MCVYIYISDNFMSFQVQYQADSITLDVLSLAETDPALMTSHGTITLDQCQDVHSSQPITFTNQSAWLAGPKWNAFHRGSFGFQFRTNEPNGLLVYSRSVQKKRHRRLKIQINVTTIKTQICYNLYGWYVTYCYIRTQ